MNTTWETHKFEHYIFSLLLAVEVIMSFTFLGYVHIPPISITTAYIPIIITACLFGPAEASLAGLLFGLGSLYKASATYVMPADAVFSPFRSDFPIGSILLSVGTRVLFGFLLGCLFQLARKSKRKNLCKLLITIAAPKLHALLVYTAMGLFFPSLGFNFSSTFMLEKSDLIILLFCAAVVLAIDKLYHSSFIQTYKKAVNEYENTPYWSPKIGFVLGAVSTFIFCMAVLSTVYFSSRMYYMLGQHGFGLFAGTAVNDTSSVTAAASAWDGIHGSNTLEIATIVKLTRTLAIIPITLVLALWRTHKAKTEQSKGGEAFSLKRAFPMFILYFVLASIITTVCTTVGVPAGVFTPLKTLSKFFIVMAMAAIGMNTNIVKLVKTGGKPIFMGFCCWVAIACVSIAMQHLLGFL